MLHIVSSSLVVSMVADWRHWEKISESRKKKFGIQKNISESKKNLWIREKNYGIEKKNLKSIKIFRNWEKISESRKLFQNREKCFRIEEYFVTRIEKKSVELNVFPTFLHKSFIVCVRLVTVKSCFAQNVALKLESFLFYMWA